MKKYKYAIIDREAGNTIEIFVSLVNAEKALIDFENEDKKLGIYEENFYEIVVLYK